MASASANRRLGRGLASLIQGPEAVGIPHVASDSSGAPPAAPSGVRMIPCTQIRPNRFQPRSDVSESEIDSLAESIRKTGVLQPILVRPDGHGFEVIAGERRWRAAERAGLAHIPAIVREASDEEMLEIALVENIFREDLNAMDRACAYRRYCEHFGLTAEQVASRLGEDRTTVTNYLRLLELPPSVQEMVRDGRLSMGHARALAGLADQARIEKLAKIASTNFFSVRALEELVRKEKAGSQAAAGGATPIKRPHVRSLEQQLMGALNTKVEILESRRKGVGRIVIHYYSLDDFDRIAQRLGLEPQ